MYHYIIKVNVKITFYILNIVEIRPFSSSTDQKEEEEELGESYNRNVRKES